MEFKHDNPVPVSSTS